MGFLRGKHFKNIVAAQDRKQQLSTNKMKRIAKREFDKRVEWKFHIYEFNVSISTTGILDDPSRVPQVTSVDDSVDTKRIGDKIMASHLKFNYSIENGDAYNNVRVIAFQWFNSSTPTVADILIISGGYDVLSQYNVDKALSYKIMYDKIHHITANYSGQTNSTNVVRKKLRLPRKQIQYEAGSTTGINKVYLMYISDSSGPSHPAINYSCKLIFNDS